MLVIRVFRNYIRRIWGFEISFFYKFNLELSMEQCFEYRESKCQEGI